MLTKVYVIHVSDFSTDKLPMLSDRAMMLN